MIAEKTLWRRLTYALPAASSMCVNNCIIKYVQIKKKIQTKRMFILLHITDPDCYKLVSISKDRSSTKKEQPTIIKTTTHEPSLL